MIVHMLMPASPPHHALLLPRLGIICLAQWCTCPRRTRLAGTDILSMSANRRMNGGGETHGAFLLPDRPTCDWFYIDSDRNLLILVMPKSVQNSSVLACLRSMPMVKRWWIRKRSTHRPA